MIREADSQQLKLPDRKEITLCEAVTAFVYGKAGDALHQMLHGEAKTEEQGVRPLSAHPKTYDLNLTPAIVPRRQTNTQLLD
jgi:hypothetical protein